METTMLQTWAFLFRGYHLTRRYISWVIVFNFYALVTSATVALIGFAARDFQLTLTLVVEAMHIFQGSLLLFSGVYYPIEVLPKWMQPLSLISPATYTLSACRKLIGVGNIASIPGHLVGAPLSAVSRELLILTLMGAVLMPLGLWVFGRIEAWAKRAGKLKSTG